MSINTVLTFQILIFGDGTSTSVEIPLGSAPFLFDLSAANAKISSLFSLATSKPISIGAGASLSGPSPPAISSIAFDSDTTHLIVTLASALPASEYTLSGQFLFA